MNHKYYPELPDLEVQKSYLPSISFILPIKVFDRSDKSFLKFLKVKLDEIEKKLEQNYPLDLVSTLMTKFEIILKDLDPEKFKLGIAIFVSPTFHKVYYLDFEPEEKLIVGDSFEIRDLIYNHDLLNSAVVLLLSANEIKFLLYENFKLSNLSVKIPMRIESLLNDAHHEDRLYFEKNERKEHSIRLLLEQADKGLGLIMQSYAHAVIVIGPEKLIATFKDMVRLKSSVIKFVYGNFFNAKHQELISFIQSTLSEIQQESENELIHSIEPFTKDQLVASGLNEVWKNSINKNCKVLLVEKNYRKPAVLKAYKEGIYTHQLDADPIPMEDVVDDIIEQVISSGGKVVFVADGMLEKYRHIVLIKNYV